MTTSKIAYKISGYLTWFMICKLWFLISKLISYSEKLTLTQTQLKQLYFVPAFIWVISFWEAWIVITLIYLSKTILIIRRIIVMMLLGIYHTNNPTFFVEFRTWQKFSHVWNSKLRMENRISNRTICMIINCDSILY